MGFGCAIMERAKQFVPGHIEVAVVHLKIAMMDLVMKLTQMHALGIAEPQSFEPGMGAMESNPVTNYSELKRELRFWAQALRDGLDELHDRGCFVCTQTEPAG